MADLNRCIFTGRLGADPELRVTPRGTTACTLSLAVDRPRPKDKDSEKETDWLTITAWSGVAEFCTRFLNKGRRIAVEASARVRKWTDKDGRARSAVEFEAQNVIPMDSRPLQKPMPDDRAENLQIPPVRWKDEPQDDEDPEGDGDLPS